MSTNDDSASRRGRRADQGGAAWRNPNRQRDEGWDQPPSGNRDSGAPYSEQRGRDNQAQQAAYSGFTRPSYSQRPEPAPQQPYYQDPAPRQDLPRYVDQAAPSYAPPPPQHLGYSDGGRDDLFTREPAPQGYDPNPYGSGYQQPYDQGPGRAPLGQPVAPQDYYQRDVPSSAEDYERGFGSRIGGQDAAASRFYLPDERPQAPHQRPPAPSLQVPADRGYAPSQSYNPGGYDQHGGGHHEPYEQHGGYDPRYEPQESWHGDEQGYHAGEEPGRHLVPAHSDELDEDFFGDEDDYEHDELRTPGRSRKKLIAAAVAAALAAGGGAYYLKHPGGGGDKATPVIRADHRPSKEMPGNPGGKQFANGDKTIYERLRPDGTTQIAPVSTMPAAPSFASAASSGSNSLEDRIDEALRKVNRTGGAPAAPAGPLGTDQPTVVSSETYTPDGRRVDAARPVITPTITNVNNGLPYPFGNAPAAAAPQPADAAPFRTAPAPQSQPQQQFANTMAAPPPAAAKSAVAPRAAARPAPAAAEPAAATATASGFYVSLKSAPDEKAIQKDLPALTKKYESVLGDVQLTTKIADLGAKGVTYRAVAGPLGTRQEAMDLCQKIKGVGGDKACFVTN